MGEGSTGAGCATDFRTWMIRGMVYYIMIMMVHVESLFAMEEFDIL